MTQIEAAVAGKHTDQQSRKVAPVAGVVCGGLGILAAVWAYWLLVPGVVFGVAAIVIGARGRRRGAREAGSVAVALGIVAVLLVPAVLAIVDDAEDWGRHCALNPSNPDC
jgi:hypothetical protein